MSPSDRHRVKTERLDPAIVVAAYRSGFFPMAESRTGPIAWYSPDPRAVIPLDAFNIPRTVRRARARSECTVTINTAFPQVIAACAGRPEGTWISSEIVDVYTVLHRQGIAHSVETWLSGRLAGGLYGVSIGGAFFGESMFSRESNMSKFALMHLVERLVSRGFLLLDTQIVNDHMRQFGAVEIPRQDYLAQLGKAISARVTFLE